MDNRRRGGGAIAPLLHVFLILFSLFLFPAPQAQAALTDGLVGNSTFDGKDTNWGTNKTNDVLAMLK